MLTCNLDATIRESGFVLVTPQHQYLLVAGNVGLRDLWIEALALHGVPFEKQEANVCREENEGGMTADRWTGQARTFGEELEVITQRENSAVPKFLSNAIQFLSANGNILIFCIPLFSFSSYISAIQEPNLFTTPTPPEEINRLKDIIDEGTFSFILHYFLCHIYNTIYIIGIEIDLGTCSSVHAVANLLVKYLYEIPDTLLTSFRYEKFFDASGLY